MLVENLISHKTKGYSPLPYDLAGMSPLRIPRFRRSYIPVMMDDPRIKLGMRILHGTIFARATVNVVSENAELQEYVLKQVERYWRHSASLTLNSLYWGYSGSEVMYTIKDNLYHFDKMKYLSPLDLIAVTLDGERVGFKLRRVAGSKAVYVGGAKAFWTVNEPEYNPYYGLSRLKAPYPRWYEFISRNGANDIRQLYFRKYAFNGDIIYHPVGTYTDSAGNVHNFEVDARNIAERRLAGGVVAMPNTRDEQGNRLWELTPGGATGGAQGDVLEYSDKLKEEMLEGIGIPPEVIEASGTGAYAGRAVPADAFYCSCHSAAQSNVDDFDNQVIKNLIIINDLPMDDYAIEVSGIKPDKEMVDGEGSPDGDGDEPNNSKANTNTKPKQEPTASPQKKPQ